MNRTRQTTLTPMGTRSKAPEKGGQSSVEDENPNQVTDSANNEQDNEPPVTTASIKELMLSMQVSINKSTQEIIEDLREDVIVIGEKLDKTGERFGEAEGRISAIEDRMNNLEDNTTEVDTIN